MIFRILKQEFFWLLLIVLIAFVLRAWRIDSPIADWHSWRQADTAAVTRNFMKEGFNPFLPRFDDMSAISEIPMPNPLGFRFVEFPVYNIFVLPLYIFFGVDEKLSRLVSVLFSLGSIIFLYFIVKKYSDKWIAFLSAFTFAILPFNVFFSRTTLPEPTFLFFALGMMLFVSRLIDRWQLSNLILALIFTSLAFLIKPWAVFFYLPLFHNVFKKKIFWKFIIFSIIALLPFIFWRVWILQQPEGIPASSWLFNGDGIRFRPSFWWWIISERLGREILGVTGLILFFIGVISKSGSGNYFLHFWLLSIFLFFIVFATGNVRHNYYQYIFVPVGAIFVSTGFINLLKLRGNFIPRIFLIFSAFFLYVLTIFFTTRVVTGFYQINNPVIVEAGKKADQLLLKDATVIASYNGDTAFLYQVNRRGFPYIPLPIRQLIADYGVTHYISTTYDDQTNWVIRHFKVVEKNPQFIIADLTKLEKPFDSLNDPEP